MRKDHDSNSKPDNGRPRSGGPRTEEGKAKSSANSQRHGILSEKIVVLQSENPEAYNQLRRNYFDSLAPIGFLECDLVEDIVWSKWRQMRAMRVETATIDEQMDRQAGYWERVCPTVDSATRTGHAMKTLVDESNDLQHLSRYETRFHRMYHRSLRQLLELQEKRRRDGAGSEPQPAPGTPAEPENTNLPNEQPEPSRERALGAPFTIRNVTTAPNTQPNRAADTPPPLTVAA
jgi:hypothetical protein